MSTVASLSSVSLSTLAPDTIPLLGWIPPHSFLPSFEADQEPDQTPPTSWDDIDLSWLITDGNTTDIALSQELMLFLYFSDQRVYGLEMHIETVYRRLEDSSNLPHPALLAAMYAVVSHASKSPAQRARAATYGNEADTQINDAFRAMGSGETRLLDVMRAATLMSGWLWGNGRDAEALIMGTKAVRLAQGLCLDCFPTHHPNAAHFATPRLRMARQNFGPPLTGHVDLADRLYAFWAVYLLDLSAAISTRMPPSLDPSRVTTPLPRLWGDYSHPASLSDTRLSDLFDPKYQDPVSQPDLVYIIRSVTLLYYASLPLTLLPTPAYPCKPRMPPEADSSTLILALDRFQASLPPDWSGITTAADGKRTVSSRTATIQCILGVAEMWVHDVNTYANSNDTAVRIARRLAGIIRLLGAEEIGDQSLFVYMMWVMTARVLIRESKRLASQGDQLGAAVIDADVDGIVAALRADRSESVFASAEAEAIEDLRRGPPSESGEEPVLDGT